MESQSPGKGVISSRRFGTAKLLSGISRFDIREFFASVRPLNFF